MCSEHGTSSGVRIEKPEGFTPKAESPPRIANLVHIRKKKHKLGTLGIAQSEQAKRDVVFYCRKDLPRVDETDEMDELLLVNEVTKEPLEAVNGH